MDDVVKRWARGDRAAGAEVVDRFGPRVYNLCLRMLGNAHDAEDATQQAFANVCRDPAKLDDVRDFEGWMLTVAANVARNMLKTRGRHRRLDSREVAMEILPEVDHAPAFDGAEPERLAAAIASLPEPYRLAVLYRYQQDLEFDRIAELMGTTPGNIRVMLHRALGALREKMK